MHGDGDKVENHCFKIIISVVLKYSPKNNQH